MLQPRPHCSIELLSMTMRLDQVAVVLENCALYRHPARIDPRGSLVAIEGGSDIPFEIARVYYLFGIGSGAERGFHAHRALDQWAVCVAGSCLVTVDDGRERQDIRLHSPDLGLRIGPMVWHEMRDFSPDCVLMVLAAAPFDEADYIRDYQQFLSLSGRGVAK